ncbi:MAG: mechanosensitive ion channel family protein [Planctomycetota bacterium]
MLPQLPQFLQQVYFDNSLERWGIAIAATVGALIVLTIVRKQVATRAGSYLAQKTQSGAAFVGRLLQRTSVLVVLALSVWFGARFVTLSPGVAWLIQIAVAVTLALQAISWAMEGLEFGLQSFLARHRQQQGVDDPGLATAIPAIRFLARLVVIVVIAMLALQNIGIDVTAMVTGLGVGGIAIALAVQNILGDLFASLSIVLDKPFVVGDSIVVGDKAGTVEKIGLKTTRVRSISGEQLIFANSDLLGSRIQNFKRMRERRIVFTIGVTYQTPMDTVSKLAGVIRECIAAQPKARFDRSHFKAYGASSLDFESVYWVLEPEYGTYMDTQQAINLAIGQRFEELRVEFAYPTQTVFLARERGAVAAE